VLLAALQSKTGQYRTAVAGPHSVHPADRNKQQPTRPDQQQASRDYGPGRTQSAWRGMSRLRGWALGLQSHRRPSVPISHGAPHRPALSVWAPRRSLVLLFLVPPLLLPPLLHLLQLLPLLLPRPRSRLHAPPKPASALLAPVLLPVLGQADLSASGCASLHAAVFGSLYAARPLLPYNRASCSGIWPL
jgi:hypothetical protein